MRVRRPATATLVVALLLSALAACTAPPAEPPTAAVVMPALEGRFTDVAELIEQRLVAEGWTVELHGTDGDIPAQVTTVDELIDEGVDALVVWPIDGTSLTPVVAAAPESTTIVALGGMIYDTLAVDAFIGFDAAAAGALQAQTVLDGLEGDGPFDVELFVGSPDNAATEPGYAGIMSVLGPALASGRVVIRSGERDLEDVTTMRGNDETAASRMTRILHDAYGTDLPDAVIATHDEIARGVAAALMEAGAVPGEGFPLITGRGAELRSLAALVDGRQFSTLLEDPRALGEAAADVLLGLATPSADMDGVPALLVPGASVRVDDIDEVVVGSGYWSRERVDEAIQEYGLPPVLVLSPTPTATPAP